MVVVSNSFEAPVDEILLESPGTKLLVNDEDWGTATLYITQNNVVWGGGFTAAGTPAATLSLLYPTISLHAIQRDPSPALYLQLSYDIALTEPNEEDDDFDALDIEPVSQIRFIPENENSLQAMYNALTTGQSLHPDPEDELHDDDFLDGEEEDKDDDDEDDEAFEDAEEINGTADQAASKLSNLRLDNSNGSHGNGDVV